MSEHNRKNYGDNDSIKAMLERLRRSVTDLPPAEEKERESADRAVSSPVGGAETPKADPVSEKERQATPAREPEISAEQKGEEKVIEPEEPSTPATAPNIAAAEEPAAEEPAAEEPIVPIAAKGQSKMADQTPPPQPNEEEMVLLPWEEDTPVADEEPMDGEENVSERDSAAARAEAGDEIENDEEDDAFFTADIDDDALAEFFEPAAVTETPMPQQEDGNEAAAEMPNPAMTEAAASAATVEEEPAAAESTAADALPQGFVDVVDATEPEREEVTAVPTVTDDEAALLFRAEEERWEPPAAPKAPVDEQRNEVAANEDNGYAVEVEVHRPVRNVTSPWAALQEEATTDAVQENEEKTTAGPVAASENTAGSADSTPAMQPRGGATPGLSNGSTRWHDNGARRRPVEVLETSDVEEAEPPTAFYKTARKGRPLEKKAGERPASPLADRDEPMTGEGLSQTAPAATADQTSENTQTAGEPPKAWAVQAEAPRQTSDGNTTAKNEPFASGVQLTIDDIKGEKVKQPGLLAKWKQRFTSKPPAEKKPKAAPARPLKPKGQADRNTAREETRDEALNDLYREEAAAYNEYTSHNQMGLFRRKFESELSLLALRVGILTFLATFLLILENGLGWGLPLERVFLTPVSMAVLHLLLLFFALLCSIPLFSRAWRQLFASRIVSELFVAVGLLCAMIYGAVLCFSLVANAGEGTPHAAVHLFGFLPVLAALVATITESQKAKNDLASFSLISSAGDKLACTVKNGGSTVAESAAVADLQEGEQTRIVSVKKVGFTSGFFYRVTRNCEDEQKNLWLLPMAAIAACLVALLVGFLESDLLGACYAFCVTFSLALPLCTLILHKLPVSILFRYASSLSCAVVGEVSAIEYSDADAFAFEDVEAFSARGVRVQRIKLYHESALDRVMYQVANVFSLVGGPLDGVFRNSTAELGLSSDVSLQRVLDGGLIASVDGQRICVGSGDFMLKQKIRMYYDAEDEQILANGKTCIMYIAEEGRLSAKFYIRYRMDEAFERDVERLAAKNIRILIRTFDPNIRKVLIDKISYTGRYDVRVVRKTIEQQHDYAAPQINSGIVTRRSVREIVRVLLACRRACRLTALSERGGLVIGCVGMLLSVLLAALGLLLSAPSWLLAVYQLLWILPVWLSSTLYITRK